MGSKIQNYELTFYLFILLMITSTNKFYDAFFRTFLSHLLIIVIYVINCCSD